MNTIRAIAQYIGGLFEAPRPMCKRVRMAMIDLETFDTDPTAGFYAIGARMFTLGEFIGESQINPDKVLTNTQEIAESTDFLRYIEPAGVLNDSRFTSSEDTMIWTMERNMIEFRRAQDQGIPMGGALDDLDAWLAYNKPEYVASNSPTFDHSILRHAYKQLKRAKEFPFPHFRTDFDVRTIGHLRHSFGMCRYAPKQSGNRLHSPLDDCTMQINAIAGFIQAVERNKF